MSGSNGNGNGNGHTSAAAILGPFPDARILLDKYGLRAKKQFGQNFLVSERALRAIADATVSTDEDWIVEIGAGLGTLTAQIVERVTAGKVIALETRSRHGRACCAPSSARVEQPRDPSHVDAMRFDLRAEASLQDDHRVRQPAVSPRVAADVQGARRARPRAARRVHDAEGDGGSHRREARRQGLRRARRDDPDVRRRRDGDQGRCAARSCRRRRSTRR